MLKIGDLIIDNSSGLVGEIVDIKGDIATITVDGAAIPRMVFLSDCTLLEEE